MKKIFTCVFIAALFLCNTTNLHAQVNVQDSLALIDLYNSTNGPGWSSHINWLTTESVNNWYGITVNNGRVIKISLAGNNLTGHILSSLGNLFDLQYLNLSHNNLKQDIPSSLGNLSNLTTLNLSNNRLQDSIPSSLGKLSKLRILDLGRNQKLTGNIPSSLGNLSNLTTLYLLANQLSGSIPSSLGNLSNLATLYLQDNQLSGNIPSQLGKLSNLQILHLGNNQLSGTIPSSLSKLSNLQDLYLQNNQLSGSIPSSLDSLSLRNIYLNDNKFTFAGMEGVVEANFQNRLYAPQAKIPLVQKNDSVLSVDAGGTLSNNTYKWYKDGLLVATKSGKPNFTTTGAGKYNVVVTNSICTKLALRSSAITITNFSADKNVLSKTNTKTFIYPNPANNLIHLTLEKPAAGNTTIVLYNMQGKAMMQQKIAAGSITQQYSINNLAHGNYLLVIKENGKKIHEERLVIVR